MCQCGEGKGREGEKEKKKVEGGTLMMVLVSSLLSDLINHLMLSKPFLYMFFCLSVSLSVHPSVCVSLSISDSHSNCILLVDSREIVN